MSDKESANLFTRIQLNETIAVLRQDRELKNETTGRHLVDALKEITAALLLIGYNITDLYDYMDDTKEDMKQ